MRLRDTRSFLSELAVLLDSGVPVQEALDSLADGQSELSAYARRLTGWLGGGESLAAAMRREGCGVPATVIAVVEAAEQSGKLPELLRDLVGEIDRQLEVRERFRRTCGYPAICLVAAVVLLPLPLAVLGRLSTYFLIESVTFGTTAILAAVAFWVARRRRQSPARYLVLETVALALPFLGPVLYQISLGRALRLLGTLLDAGLSFEVAIALVVDSVPLRPVRVVFDDLRTGIAGGGTVADSLGRTGSISGSALTLIHTGEVSGTLDRALRESGDRLLESCWRRLDSAVRFLPVAIILVVGAIILIVAIRVFGRLYGEL